MLAFGQPSMLSPHLLVQLKELLIVNRPRLLVLWVVSSLILLILRWMMTSLVNWINRLLGTVVKHGFAPLAFIDCLFKVERHNWLQMLVLCIVWRLLALLRSTLSELLVILVVIVRMLRPRELLRATLTMLAGSGPTEKAPVSVFAQNFLFGDDDWWV